MDGIDVSAFDLDEFEGFGSSVQKFLDGALDGDYFNLDMYETGSDFSSDISFEPENDEPKRKRKLNMLEEQQNFKLARPRIVKSDFRRTFPQMWASVFNSANYETMRNHIGAFYDSNVTVLQQDVRSAVDPSRVDMSRGPEIGHDYLSEFWYRSMKIAPDLVCTLKHSYVKVRSDGTSCIKCTFGLTGTKVITVDGALVLTDGTKVVNLRTVHAAARTEPVEPGNDLQRFVSGGSVRAESGEDSISSSSAVASTQETDPLSGVLQRYLKASSAVCRSKAHPNESRRKRRQRLQKAAAHEVPVEEWLALKEVCAQTAQAAPGTCDQVACAQTESFTQYARVVDDTVCISRINQCSLRGDNDRTLPVARAYTVQHGQQGEVLLTTDFDFTCAIEMNFNADHRIVSLVLNYLD